jgi:hypothetical protein
METAMARTAALRRDWIPGRMSRLRSRMGRVTCCFRGALDPDLNLDSNVNLPCLRLGMSVCLLYISHIRVCTIQYNSEPHGKCLDQPHPCLMTEEPLEDS